MQIYFGCFQIDELGLVYLEAQACGCPAMGRNKAGVPESIANNKSGYLINNAEEVFDILKSKKYSELKKEDILSFPNQFISNAQSIL